MIKFQAANDQAKLHSIKAWWDRDDEPTIFTITLPAGFSCPFALICLSKADRVTGRITDGKHTTVRCFEASLEARPNVRANAWRNFDALRSMKTREAMGAALRAALPPKANVIRVHVGGDFYNQAYFDAWLDVARAEPGRIFYAYTKSLPYWVARLGEIPANFKLTASRGGSHDDLIQAHGLREAVIVFSEAEAEALGLEIDHDERHAIQDLGSFALLVHGTQPKGSEAAAAIRKLKADGVQHSYSR